MRKKRALPDGLVNATYPSLCYPSRSLRGGRRAPRPDLPGRASNRQLGAAGKAGSYPLDALGRGRGIAGRLDGAGLMPAAGGRGAGFTVARSHPVAGESS